MLSHSPHTDFLVTGTSVDVVDVFGEDGVEFVVVVLHEAPSILIPWVHEVIPCFINFYSFTPVHYFVVLFNVSCVSFASCVSLHCFMGKLLSVWFFSLQASPPSSLIGPLP